MRKLSILVVAALVAVATAFGIGHLSRVGDNPPITLRVADQYNILRTIVESAGEGQPKDYKIEWANIAGGPSVIAAETGGSIDVGWMAETPIVFAVSAGSPVRVIAALRSLDKEPPTFGLVVSQNSPIQTIADLKGKKVSYGVGTVTQYFLIDALGRAGLGLDDVTSVHVPSGSPSALLGDGSVDAVVTADPFLSPLLDQGGVRILPLDGAPFTETWYLVAPKSILETAKLDSVLSDFVARVARAYRWRRENVEAAVPDVANAYKTSAKVAREIIEHNPAQGVPINTAIIGDLQTEADAFLHAGVIKQHIDVDSMFDQRFNAVVSETNRLAHD